MRDKEREVRGKRILNHITNGAKRKKMKMKTKWKFIYCAKELSLENCFGEEAPHVHLHLCLAG